MNTERLKTAYKKACTAKRLLNEVKILVSENGGIQGSMYIVHDAISNTKDLVASIKQVYANTIED